MSKETEFKEYDIVVGDGGYWLVVERNDGIALASIDELYHYREGQSVSSYLLYDFELESFEKSSLREYFNHIYGGDLYKELFTAGYKALLGDIKQPKEYTDKIVENAFNEWLKE